MVLGRKLAQQSPCSIESHDCETCPYTALSQLNGSFLLPSSSGKAWRLIAPLLRQQGALPQPPPHIKNAKMAKQQLYPGLLMSWPRLMTHKSHKQQAAAVTQRGAERM